MSNKTPQKPLSPHLQIYKPMLSMIMSIAHRITGAGLYFGMAFLAWWLLAAATSADYFNLVQAIYGSWLGRLILFGFTWALLHHAIGGIRHFIWDTGRGFELETVEIMAKINLATSIVLTTLIWVIAYAVR